MDANHICKSILDKLYDAFLEIGDLSKKLDIPLEPKCLEYSDDKNTIKYALHDLDFKVNAALMAIYKFTDTDLLEKTETVKTYADYANDLMDRGYVCLGRYEHTFKKDAMPVMYSFFNPSNSDQIMIEVSTNELGVPTKVIKVYGSVTILNNEENHGRC